MSPAPVKAVPTEADCVLASNNRPYSLFPATGTHPKVWMLIPTFYPVIGGAQNQVRKLSQVLMRSGWPVHVLTRQRDHVHPEKLPSSDIVSGTPVTRLCSLGAGKLDSLLYVLNGLWYLLSHGRDDIYHAHDISAAGWLALAARYLLGGRCLIKLRTGCYGYQSYLSSRLTRWQFMTQMRLADRIVVVNRELEGMLQRLGLKTHHVVRIPNMIDVGAFRPASGEEKIAARKQLGLQCDQTVFLYAGRLAPYKGAEMLVRAWKFFSAGTRQGTCLILAGDGPLRNELRRLIISLDIDPSVRMVGTQQAIRDYYWASDVFVLPSQTEGLSNTLIEAMACGLPVVATRVGGTPDVVEDGKSGLLFEPNNVSRLAQTLHSILDTRSNWTAMGRNGRSAVIAYAELESVSTRFRNLYGELAQEMRTQGRSKPRLSTDKRFQA